MTFEEWEEKYKPIPVPGSDELFSWNYAELGSSRRTEKNLWTVVEGDNGGLYITDGFHFVNRMGYVLTEVDFDEPESIEVCFLDPEEFADEPEQGFSQEDIDAARREAVAEERAAVVAWLRERARTVVVRGGLGIDLCADRNLLSDAIERGEHRREGEK